MSLLKVEHLHKSFKGLQVLKDVSLEVKQGERHVIIGPNGAGKTTLFNCITGTLPINQGTVTVNGKQINGLPGYTAVRVGMSRTFQKKQFVWCSDRGRERASSHHSMSTISVQLL